MAGQRYQRGIPHPAESVAGCYRPARAGRRLADPPPLELDDLGEARRVLECPETRGRPGTVGGASQPPNGRDRPGCADHPTERERPQRATRTERPPPPSLIHASIVRMQLVSLGDLILDVVVGLDGPLVPGDDRLATTSVGAGGQAANVAAWAASLGADARYVGKRGADAAGTLAAAELLAHGVELAGPATGRNGVVVSIAAAGERSMASDRG